MESYKNCRVIVRKLEFEIVVGKLVVLEESIEILAYHVMYLEKWHMNVYYQV